MKPEELSDEELLRQAQAGSQAAIEALASRAIQELRPLARRLSMHNAMKMTSRLVALTLLVTAFLKLLYFWGMPVSRVKADPVIGFLTVREALFLASMVELAVARLLWTPASLRQSACVVLYFSVCATLYQIGLVLSGFEQHCSCLSVMTAWLGARTTTLLSRALLVVFWIVGLLQLRCASVATRLPRQTGPLHSCLMLFVALSAGCVWSGAAPVELEGEYRDYRMSSQGGQSKLLQRLPFRATVDSTALLVSYVPPLPPARYQSFAFTNFAFIDRSDFVCLRLPVQSDDFPVGAVLRDAKPVWELGNCGDGLTTCAFVMSRCLDLFPKGSGAKTRPFAETGVFMAEALALITEAEYRYSSDGETQALSCDVRVSKSLRDTWQLSPLLNPGLDTSSENKEFRHAKSDVDSYPAGFIVEKMEFTKFENVAGLRFPTLGEFKRYSLPRKPIPGAAPREVLFETLSVEVRYVGPSAVPRIRLPPSPAGKKVSVVEARLTDRSLHIDGVEFTTDRFVSTEVCAAARSAFDEAARLASQRMRIARVKRVLTFTLFSIAIAGPAVLAYRYKRCPPGSVPPEAVKPQAER